MAPPASIQPAVQKYFEQHPGVTVYIDDLCSALDLRRQQVQTAVQRLMAKELLPLEVVHNGNAWTTKRRVEKKSNKTMFEEVGTARDGRVVIQAEDGSLWIATQI
jgi:hypothetical protein